MITSSTASLIASVIARKSSISYDGTPSGVRAWMWIIDPPSSTIRRASAAYSSGVYGIAGHWSRLATAPEIAQVRMTGLSRVTGRVGRLHDRRNHRRDRDRHHRGLSRPAAAARPRPDGIRADRDLRHHRRARRLLPLHRAVRDR